MSTFLSIRSDDCKEYFPHNRASKFQINLPSSVAFPCDQFEVGLRDISLYIFDDDDFSLRVITGSDVIHILIEFQIGADLITCVQTAITKSAKKLLHFHWDSYTEKVVMTVKADVKVIISPALANWLGFDSQNFLHGKHYSSCKPQHFYQSLNSRNLPPNIFVVTNLGKAQILGNRWLKYLSILPIREDSKTIIHQLSNVYYIPLNINPLTHVEVMLCDHLGNEVCLKGRTIVLLEIKPK